MDENLTLLSDINSYGKGQKKYGSKGEKVKLIAEHGEILIVENERGERFSVKKENVKEEKV